MKTQTNWTVRLRWTIRRLQRLLRSRTSPSGQKWNRLAQLGYRLLRLVLLLLRAVLLIRELIRLILRSFQGSGKN